MARLGDLQIPWSVLYPGYMPGTGDTPLSRQLGALIKQAREDKNLGLRPFARQLGISHTELNHYESGRRPPTVEKLAGILGALGVNGDRRVQILQLAEHVGDPNLVTSGVDRQLAMLIEYERTCKSIFEAHNTLPPGKYQTREFMRQLMRKGGTPASEIEQKTLVRLSRREIIDRIDPVECEVVLGEQAVRYPQCDRPSAIEQLKYLLRVGAKPNVTIRVVKFDAGYTPLSEGPFVLLQFPDGTSPVVQIEALGLTVTATDRDAVTRYMTAADNLRKAALGPDKSAEFIAEVVDGMERVT